VSKIPSKKIKKDFERTRSKLVSDKKQPKIQKQIIIPHKTGAKILSRESKKILNARVQNLPPTKKTIN
jgi:hypothetical protein